MIPLPSKVGPWTLKWKTIPRGQEGVAVLDVEGGTVPPILNLEIRWKRDAHGIWIQLPTGMHGFDLRVQKEAGEPSTYQLLQRMKSHEWSGILTLRGNIGAQQMARSQRTGVQRVRAQMPGKIIRVLVETGQGVHKNHPLLVMEAMKMENEIRAPLGGRISQLKVTEGQIVETGADLLFIDAQEV